MRNMKKMKKRSIAALVCTVITSGMLCGCGEQVVEEKLEDVAIIEAANPIVGDLKLSSKYIATLSPDESVYVIPKATAEVLEVSVKAGDVVEEGEVLAVLDDTMAQISMQSARITLDNAQHAYNLSYGEGATTLNDMQTDSNLTKVEDNVVALQENLVTAMDNLQKSKDALKEEEKKLEDVKNTYGFKESVSEINDYAYSIDQSTLQGKADYAAAMSRYNNATIAVTPIETKIAQYKAQIDAYEETIDTLQKNIDTAYEGYGQTVVSTTISNGEMREEQKKVSQNSISAAQLSIKQAQENLNAYTITAPISGVIDTVNISKHAFATSSNAAFVISNKETMMAVYYVSEDVRNSFEVGQKVKIEKDSQQYDAEIVEIGESIDPNTNLFKIKAKIDGDSSTMLSGTKVTVITDTYHADHALIIPYDSVYYDGTQAYVYVVIDGIARKQNITTGLYDTENIVVTDGLNKDDIVVTTWSAQLREGVAVSIVASKAN